MDFGLNNEIDWLTKSKNGRLKLRLTVIREFANGNITVVSVRVPSDLRLSSHINFRRHIPIYEW